MDNVHNFNNQIITLLYGKLMEERNLYRMLKDDGWFYYVLGSLISAENKITMDLCERNMKRLKRLLEEIPEEETVDREEVKDCMKVIEREMAICRET